MKKLFSLVLVLGALCLAGCEKDITFSAGTSGTKLDPTPPDASPAMNRGDVVAFINKDDRIHKIVVVPGSTAPAVGSPLTATTIYPPGGTATQSSKYVWPIPAGTSPPATFSWACVIHPGESGSIFVTP